MENYIQKLLQNPSEDSLNRIEKEIERSHDIINSYYDIINWIIREGGKPESSYSFEKMNRIVEKEKKFMNKCREIRDQIQKILNQN